MALWSFSKRLAREADTQHFAQQLANLSSAGDVYLLEGPVGAGKTALARAFIQSLLQAPEDVPSPTFTLVQTYETPEFDIWHCDLYRLSSSQDVFELGLDEAFETDVCLIEWPDRLGSISPKNALHITLEVDQESRILSAVGDDPKWQKLEAIFD